MSRQEFGGGFAELRAARCGHRGLFWAVGIFSTLVNFLMFTGPLYMMQVYDRVLGSRSLATLVALSVLVTFLFVVIGLLDHARGRVMARIGANLQEKLDDRVFSAAIRRMSIAPTDPVALAAQRDLEALQRLWASPVLMAIFDIPWTPLFIAAIFVFHPVLGWLAISGGLVLIALTVLNQKLTQEPFKRTNGLTLQSDRLSDLIKTEAETVRALGMTGAAFSRWHKVRSAALAEGLEAGDIAGRFGSTSKAFRMFLQSAMLGAGAWLVLRDQLSPGAMIAGSILMGRALQPIEQAVGQWPMILRAQEGTKRLAELLSRMPPERHRTDLPRPRAILQVSNLAVAPPGETQAVLRGVSFQLGEGQALGVIGPSGAGKSTLARALIGIWRPAAGVIRLDRATLDQYDPDVLGSYIGYLPQRVTLFEGTIADNIARLNANADSTKVVEAAKRAAAHDMILRLPEGYDTRVSTLGGRLSGGQVQRIGLARALYGDPVLLVLDEPNSNLDNDGTAALNGAIRHLKAAGGSVLIMAHRPAAIQECGLLLVLEDGSPRAFGPRDQVLREMVKNHTEIVRSTEPGGVA